MNHYTVTIEKGGSTALVNCIKATEEEAREHALACGNSPRWAWQVTPPADAPVSVASVQVVAL